VFSLQEDGSLSKAEDAAIEALRQWFNRHLAQPAKFTRSKSKAQDKKYKALSWFKDSAVEHLRKIREAAEILEAHGVNVRMITCERPGYIVYEDRYQIVAEPFADTAT
jgi:hypothetical protein